MTQEKIISPYKASSHDSDNLSMLLAECRAYLPEVAIDKIKDAYEYAAQKHEGQFRKSGEAYINHPVEVALILAADLQMDEDTICAALLHDTVEDTNATFKELTARYGQSVSELVDGVTKLTNIEVDSLSGEQAANLRKMFLAMSKDIRVIIIKLADRLHNMRTLMALAEDRRIFKAHETMDVYAPLANRLGMSSIKWELEDLSFFYLQPAEYRKVARLVSESREAREDYLDSIIAVLREDLQKANITDFTITGRPKHLYSIYRKLSNKDKDFSEIYDLIAVRVITKTVSDCYTVLGTVHSSWKPVPGRFKDYIAMPKYNMYQSLHTTVIGPAARPLEIQIRTEEMHQQAEYGIAAHWLYKEAGNSEGDKDQKTMSFDEQLSWLHRTLDWQQQDDMDNPREFLDALKLDLFEDEVFVFTPKGEVVSLRMGSTPLDFAYSIHSEVGHHCVGAKINGSVVPLSYELKMGDRVVILTQKNSFPSRDWLNIVKMPSSRAKIRSYFSKISRTDDISSGRERIGRDLRKSGFGISSPRTVRAIKKVAADFGLQSPDDLFASVGSGKMTPKAVANKIAVILDESTDSANEAEKRAMLSLATPMTPPRTARTSISNKVPRSKKSNGVIVKGASGDFLVRLAKCCVPVAGDDIIGFVTRGRGVSVHRSDCPNVAELMSHPERMIEVEWDTQSSGSFQVEITIEAIDRTRLLTDITIAIADSAVNILSSASNATKHGTSRVRFLVELSELSQLDKLLSTLKGVEGVLEARRLLPGEGGSSLSRNG